MLNAASLWATRYLDSATHQVRDQGHHVRDEDATRLSPQDCPLNVLGRYAIAATQPHTGIRPLRDPFLAYED